MDIAALSPGKNKVCADTVPFKSNKKTSIRIRSVLLPDAVKIVFTQDWNIPAQGYLVNLRVIYFYSKYGL
jgi:hypothetical protein